FPVYGAKLVPAAGGTTLPATVKLETVELEISGMTCEACAGVVKYELNRTAGVADAEVDYPAGLARVNFDPATVKPAQLVEAVNRTGYKATLLEP
ncbi:MAG: heavy-metal-associated domain-containing protein, partial [Terriglobia bacterium]